MTASELDLGKSAFPPRSQQVLDGPSKSKAASTSPPPFISPPSRPSPFSTRPLLLGGLRKHGPCLPSWPQSPPTVPRIHPGPDSRQTRLSPRNVHGSILAVPAPVLHVVVPGSSAVKDGLATSSSPALLPSRTTLPRRPPTDVPQLAPVPAASPAHGGSSPPFISPPARSSQLGPELPRWPSVPDGYLRTSPTQTVYPTPLSATDNFVCGSALSSPQPRTTFVPISSTELQLLLGLLGSSAPHHRAPCCRL